MFPDLCKVIVTGEGDRKLKNGNVLLVNDFQSVNNDDDKDVYGIEEKSYAIPKKNDGLDCLVYNSQGMFTAIYRYNEKIHGWKVYKMFA